MGEVWQTNLYRWAVSRLRFSGLICRVDTQLLWRSAPTLPYTKHPCANAPYPIAIFICFFYLADPGSRVSAGTSGRCMTCTDIEILCAEESYLISTQDLSQEPKTKQRMKELQTVP